MGFDGIFSLEWFCRGKMSGDNSIRAAWMRAKPRFCSFSPCLPTRSATESRRMFPAGSTWMISAWIVTCAVRRHPRCFDAMMRWVLPTFTISQRPRMSCLELRRHCRAARVKPFSQTAISLIGRLLEAPFSPRDCTVGRPNRAASIAAVTRHRRSRGGDFGSHIRSLNAMIAAPVRLGDRHGLGVLLQP